MVDQSEATILKRQRATIKASCTHIRIYVESIAAISPSIMAHLEERKAKLEHYWAEYNEVQSHLESLDESEDCNRDGFEEAFYALSAKIRELIFPSSTLRMSIFSLSSSSVRDSDRSTHIRLPKLNLPTFSGKYEWFPFFDTFNSVIHSSLRKDFIIYESFTGAIWQQARDCSNSCQSYNGFVDYYKGKCNIRRISDSTAKHLHALQALKRSTTHWDDFLVLILTFKLNSLTLREWKLP